MSFRSRWSLHPNCSFRSQFHKPESRYSSLDCSGQFSGKSYGRDFIFWIYPLDFYYFRGFIHFKQLSMEISLETLMKVQAARVVIGASHYHTEKCAVQDVATYLQQNVLEAIFLEDPVLEIISAAIGKSRKVNGYSLKEN